MPLDQTSFDPEFASPSDWARMYRAHGIQVVPAIYPMTEPGHKRPDLANWKEFQNQIAPDPVFEKWFPNTAKPNMGMITGLASGNIICVDLDDYKNQGAADWFSDIMPDPETWAQRTGGGGRQIFFRLPEGVSFPNAKSAALGVDIRCQGGFAMLPPSLHLSGKNYEWLPGCAPWEVELDTAPARLIEAVKDLIGTLAPHAERADPQPTPDHPTNEFGATIDGREDYMTRLIWAAVVDLYRESPILSPTDAQEAMKAAFATYERKVRSRLHDGSTPNHILLEREGRGISLFRQKWQYAIRQWDGKVAQAAAVEPDRPLEDEAAPDTHEGAPATGFDYVNAFEFDPSEIPLRPWIVRGLLMRGYIAMLVGTGGTGKSLFSLQLSAAIASGADFGGFSPEKPCNVLIVNAEDDVDEQRRRLTGIIHAMELRPAAMLGRVYLANNPPSLAAIAKDQKTGLTVVSPVITEIVKTIEALNIDVLVVDPFSETISGDENSAENIVPVMRVWRDQVARAAKCAVMLVHHTPKNSGGRAGDQDVTRGSGAITAAARTNWTVFPMSEDDASGVGVPPAERHHYIRVDDAKMNYGVLSGTARWFKKVEHDVGNGGVAPGDKVGALEPWHPPSAFDCVTPEMSIQVLYEIEKRFLEGRAVSIGRGVPDDSPKSVVSLVCEMTGVEAMRANLMVRSWMKSGTLFRSEYFDNDQRKTRIGLTLKRSNIE